MKTSLFSWYVGLLRFKVLLVLLALIVIVFITFDGLVWLVFTGVLGFGALACIDGADIEYGRIQEQHKKSEENEKNILLEEEERRLREQEQLQKREEIERKIEKYGDERAIELSEKQEEITEYYEPIDRLLGLYRDFDSNPEFRKEQSQPYLAIKDKAEKDSRKLYSLFSDVDRLYEKFCQQSTILIVEGKFKEAEYMSITKRVESNIDDCLDLRKRVDELQMLINKLEGRRR